MRASLILSLLFLILAVQIAPAIVLGLGMFVLPYSPRWLAQQGRHEEALQALYRLHGKEANQVVIKYEYEEIVNQMGASELRLLSSAYFETDPTADVLQSGRKTTSPQTSWTSSAPSPPFTALSAG
jgi:hypothetical protein